MTLYFCIVNKMKNNMKKLILSVAMLATITLSAVAADDKVIDDSKNVSNYVLNQFSSDFVKAKNVIWTITTNTQKADFVVDGVAKTAFYNLSGTYLGLTEEVSYKIIPTEAQEEIAKSYEGYAVGKVIKFKSAESETPNFMNSQITQTDGTLNYFVSLKKAGVEILVQVSEQGGVSFFQKVK